MKRLPGEQAGESSSDQRWIALARQGDTAAFEKLIDRHGLYIYNLALRLVSNPTEAEDIAQEAFIRVWKGLPRFRGDANFKTWLYRIVTNVCYSRLPQIKRELQALDPSDDHLAIPARLQPVEQILLNQELSERLNREMALLPESYRLLLALRHLQEMSYDEIAAVTGMPLGTVKTGIFRARRQLRAALLRQEEDYV
ncbi:MAG: sigma-70 family RNA polymerase sigma factor [Ardenticatenaceae bacterium]|nr:sigma-70 family RNA polymerase sigma factor [Ardenticatenaceae bacterium]